jgi:PAS domain-containing protein
VRRTLQALLISAQRELAMLDSALLGTQLDSRLPAVAKGYSSRGNSLVGSFQDQFENSPHPYLVVDPRPGLRIVDINDAYSQATMTKRAAVAGCPLFEVFPDNPDLSDADGVSNLYASLRAAADSGRPHAMPIQRYDIRDPDGRFVERYWRPLNTPVFDAEGRLVYLLHHVEDVTGGIHNGSV